MQRLEKLLEDALVKLSTVATDIMGVSGRAMIEALIAGQRDAQALAGLARGRMKTKRADLIEALSGRFDDHHAELARMLLDQIDALTAQIDTLTARIEHCWRDARGPARTPAATAQRPVTGRRDCRHPGRMRATHHGRAARRDPRHRRTRRAGDHRRDRAGHEPVPHRRAPGVLGEACPRTIQSGPVTRGGRTGKGNRYLKGVLGDAAAAAAKTNTFLGERYRRIVKRRGNSRPWSRSPAPSW